METRQFEPIVEMRDVGLRYGDNPEVLKNINFSFRRGSMHFLTGKSGAGEDVAAFDVVSGAEADSGNAQGLWQQRGFDRARYAGFSAAENRGRISGFPPAGAFERV